MQKTKKNPHAVALGRKGGKARSAALSPARRSEIARIAVTAYWDRKRAAAKNPPLAKKQRSRRKIAA